MEIRVAKTAGFCFGVERAVKMVYDQIREASGPIYTYGPIIHNEEVVRDLESRGVRVLQEGTVPEENGATVIIRSHGVTKAVMDQLEQSGARVLDATCPFVKKIHRLVRQETDLGRQIVIVGNSSHPEVEGIVGWCPKGAVVVSNPEEAEKTVFVILADLVLLFSYSLGGVSQYFAYRTYEGKAIIAYLYMTVIFGFCLAIYRKETSLWPWCGLFLCGTGGIAFSNSALFIVPCMIGATLFPYVLCDGILKRQWHLLKRYIIVLLPSVFWMLLSYLV